jgi:lysine 2,3-aminomutase
MPQKVLTDDDWFRAIAEMSDFGRSLGKQVAFHTHFNNPNEITELSRQALDRFFNAGVTVRNQSVLLRGVNDTREQMGTLVKRLSYINVQPYYVYVHDLVKGAEDLRTPLQTALDLEKYVRGLTAGFNTPTFVVDAPGGGGKRSAHSFEDYHRNSGISVYTAPSVKPGRYFMYFDPIDTLTPEFQEIWRDPKTQEDMLAAVLADAQGIPRGSA